MCSVPFQMALSIYFQEAAIPKNSQLSVNKTISSVPPFYSQSTILNFTAADPRQHACHAAQLPRRPHHVLGHVNVGPQDGRVAGKR